MRRTERKTWSKVCVISRHFPWKCLWKPSDTERG